MGGRSTHGGRALRFRFPPSYVIGTWEGLRSGLLAPIADAKECRRQLRKRTLRKGDTHLFRAQASKGAQGSLLSGDDGHQHLVKLWSLRETNVDLLRLIRSIEELLYELTCWLIFYPRTLWAAVRHPLRSMAYVASEESQVDDEQFTDTLAPPLLLFVSILIAHGIELGLVGLPKPSSGPIAFLFGSEQLLLIFRALLFSLFPLLGALAIVKASGMEVTRSSLRAPFYSLCTIAAPFALAQSVGGIIVRMAFDGATIVGIALMLIAALLYLIGQTVWIRQCVKVSRPRALVMSLGAFVQALL